MKGGRILFFIFGVSILGIIMYFTYPVKINIMLHNKQSMEKVHVTYISNRESLRYLISSDSGVNFDELISMLNSVSYNREIKKFKGAAGNVIMMDIVYKDKNGDSNIYFVYLHEAGIMIVDNREYKIYGDSEVLVDELYDWIRSNGTLIPFEEKIDLMENS